MTVLTIKTSAEDHIINLPEAVMAQMGWQKDALIDISIENGHLVLAPKPENLTLEALLAGSPQEKLNLLTEDTEWLSMPTIGKEHGG